ncbi:two-component sensor histidine kinase [Bifidobacterium sp. 82T10]|uniref:histidine kinase n=1 Tax=Bifidobacterium miconis TaxID=2834435 RepID=A0ABS6WBJ7_9BIFI|nr:histidine kinase [Bifidobacterium miconis]MBW3091424.1 two-component sensor histidine kinase [Bifidobacterium miconis]
MLILLEKALLLACGTAVAALSGFGSLSLIGLLAAVSSSCLAEWLMSRRTPPVLAAAAPCLFMASALLLPPWCAFLPAVAYDAPRLPALMRDARADRLARCLPLAPIVVAVVRASAATDRTVMMLTGLLAVIGMTLGRSRETVTGLRRSLRHTQDLARDSGRVNRRRLADVAEERAQSIHAATLNERTRIAREIHDNVGHLLTRAIMQSQAGKAVADATGDTVAAQGFDALNGTLNEAMTMVRRSVHDLEDDGTDFAAQIADAAHTFGEASPDFAVSLSNEIMGAPAPVTRCFAAVIRESLSNVARHSDARSASVTLRDFPAIWQLVVQDPGPARPAANESHATGPDGDAESLRGMGLADIERRVRALGGTSSCGPYGGGWRVFVTIPKRQWTYHDHDGQP